MNRHQSNDCARLGRIHGALTLFLGLAQLPAAEPTATNAAAAATMATNGTVTATVMATNAVKAAESAGHAVLGREFTAYQLVAQRNIFNPNRSRRSSRSGGESEKPAPRVDVIALAGTMSYTRGTFAFFDSSSAEFKKVLKAGETIAGYTVKEITPNQIKLEKESALLELKVGQQLRRESEGAWEITNGSSFTSSSTIASPGSSTSSSAAASGEGPSDALKRLLEQRKKENNP